MLLIDIHIYIYIHMLYLRWPQNSTSATGSTSPAWLVWSEWRTWGRNLDKNMTTISRRGWAKKRHWYLLFGFKEKTPKAIWGGCVDMNCAIFPLRIVGDFIFTASCFTGTLHSVQFLKYYLPVTQQPLYIYKSLISNKGFTFSCWIFQAF